MRGIVPSRTHGGTTGENATLRKKKEEDDSSSKKEKREGAGPEKRERGLRGPRAVPRRSQLRLYPIEATKNKDPLRITSVEKTLRRGIGKPTINGGDPTISAGKPPPALERNLPGAPTSCLRKGTKASIAKGNGFVSGCGPRTEKKEGFYEGKVLDPHGGNWPGVMIKNTPTLKAGL